MLVIEWIDHCPSDETGRRAGFKIQWGQPRVGSTPTSGTITLCYHRFVTKRLRFKTFLCIQVYLGVPPERHPSLALGNG